MLERGRFLCLMIGLAAGAAATAYFRAPLQPVFAFNDRHEDYVLATGPITMGVNITSDGVWLLDYRAGKLLGSVVDRNLGKVMPWAEVDLVKEFGIPPKQNVHFLMTTGTPLNGQTALYLTEINSGKFGVYSMTPALDGTGRMMIRRHDATFFRAPPPAAPPPQ